MFDGQAIPKDEFLEHGNPEQRKRTRGPVLGTTSVDVSDHILSFLSGTLMFIQLVSIAINVMGQSNRVKFTLADPIYDL
jgi:hypothetical protein